MQSPTDPRRRTLAARLVLISALICGALNIRLCLVQLSHGQFVWAQVSAMALVVAGITLAILNMTRPSASVMSKWGVSAVIASALSWALTVIFANPLVLGLWS